MQLLEWYVKNSPCTLFLYLLNDSRGKVHSRAFSRPKKGTCSCCLLKNPLKLVDCIPFSFVVTFYIFLHDTKFATTSNLIVISSVITLPYKRKVKRLLKKK